MAQLVDEQIAIAEARRKRVMSSGLDAPERKRQRKFIRRIVVGDERARSRPTNPVIQDINERNARFWRWRANDFQKLMGRRLDMREATRTAQAVEPAVGALASRIGNTITDESVRDVIALRKLLRQQNVHAQLRLARIRSWKRNAPRVKEATAARIRHGARVIDRVRSAANEFLAKHPAVTREELAGAIAPTVHLSEERTLALLKQLRLPTVSRRK